MKVPKELLVKVPQPEGEQLRWLEQVAEVSSVDMQ